MTAHRFVNAEIQSEKRQLRAEIARTRSQAAATLAALRDERRRLTSWRTYVERFPTAALGASFGVGLWLAGARPGRRLPGMFAASLLRWGVTVARSGILNDLKAVWDASRASADSDTM